MSVPQLPSGGTVGFFDAGANDQIRYAFWERKGAKATILLLTGFNEFIEKYYEVVGDLLERGYSVFAMDWRSQGLSTRPLSNRHKIYVETFEQYLSDLHRYVETVVRKKAVGPLFILAHSMGGHIALRYIHDHPQPFTGAFLCAPMVDIRLGFGRKTLAKLLTAIAMKFGYSGDYILGVGDYGPKRKKFDGNILTSDPERFAACHASIEDNPDLAMGGPTYGWTAAAQRSIQILAGPGFPEAIKTPVFIVGAGDDRLVSTPAQNRLAKRMPKATFQEIAGARHEILMERDTFRTQLFDAFDSFVVGVEPDLAGPA